MNFLRLYVLSFALVHFIFSHFTLSPYDVFIAYPIKYSNHYNHEFYITVIILNNEKDKYEQVIIAYCWRYKINQDSCSRVSDLLTTLIDSSSNERIICNISHKDCFNYLNDQIIARPLNIHYHDIAPSLMLDKKLEIRDIAQLKLLSKMLVDNNCMGISYSNALVQDLPCDISYWVEGTWMINSTEQSIISSRCPYSSSGLVSGECDSNNDSDKKYAKNICSSFLSGGAPSVNDEYSPKRPGCLVYSIGQPDVDDWDLITEVATEQRCDVHIFGKTDHTDVRDIDTDVEFKIYRHPWTISGCSHGGLETKSLGDIMQMLGHSARPIDVLLLPDDKCSLSMLQIFVDITTEINPTHNKQLHIRYIRLRLLIDSTSEKLRLLSSFMNDWIVRGGYQLSRRAVRILHCPCDSKTTGLTSIGFSAVHCCYDIDLVWPLRLSHNEQSDISPKTNSYHSSSHNLSALSSGSLDTYASVDNTETKEPPPFLLSSSLETGRQQLDLMRMHGSNWDVFADSYKAIINYNLTVAIVQLDATIHSEMIGPLLQLCETIGATNVIVYNDVIRHGIADPFSMIPLFSGSSSWDIRAASLWLEQRDQWDLTILATGDEVYKIGASLRQVFLAVAHRVIAVHHHSEWSLPELLPKYLFVTPHEGSRRWIFPMMTFDESIISISPFTTPTPFPTILKKRNEFSPITLVITGDTVFSHGKMDDPARLKLKDRQDMIKFLDHSATNKLVCLSRTPSEFPHISQQFPDQAIGIWNLTSLDFVQTFNGYNYFWFPIPEESGYARGMLSSGIALAISLEKILVMPLHLSQTLGLTGAVVSYLKSIMEVDWTRVNADLSRLRAKLILWKNSRHIQNQINIMSCLLSTCL